MQVWNVLHVARWKYRTQKSRKKSPFGHYCTNLSGYIIFATEARIDNLKKTPFLKKKLLSSNMSYRCPHNMVNFGPPVAEIGGPVRGTPASFNGFRALAALLHGTLVVGVIQTLRRWAGGRHLYSTGRPSRWALAHFLVYPEFTPRIRLFTYRQNRSVS